MSRCFRFAFDALLMPIGDMCDGRGERSQSNERRRELIPRIPNHTLAGPGPSPRPSCVFVQHPSLSYEFRGSSGLKILSILLCSLTLKFDTRIINLNLSTVISKSLCFNRLFQEQFTIGAKLILKTNYCV